MDVVDVWVAMKHSFVTMPVGMRHLCELLWCVVVLMMLVVSMFVRVLQSLVLMQMFMPIRRQQEGARGHGRER